MSESNWGHLKATLLNSAMAGLALGLSTGGALLARAESKRTTALEAEVHALRIDICMLAPTSQLPPEFTHGRFDPETCAGLTGVLP